MLAVFFAALATGGCWSMRNINELAFVMGLGVDLAPDGHDIMTAQIAVPSAFAQLIGGGGKTSPIWVVSAYGHSLAECSITLRKIVSRQLHYGHTRVVVFGERRARRDIGLDLDAIERLPQFRRSMSIFVAKGEARAVLQAQPKLDPIGAIAMVRQADLQSYNLALGDFITAIESEQEDAAVPVVSTAPLEGLGFGEKKTGGEEVGEKKSDQGADKVVRIEGLALFRSKKMEGFLSGEAATGYFLFRNRFRDRPMTIPSARFGDVEVYVRMSKGGAEIIWKDGKPRFRMRTRTIVDVFQVKPGTDLDDSAVLRKLEANIARQMSRSLLASVRQSQRYGIDIFGLGGEVFRKSPPTWRRVRHQWAQLYSQAPVTVTSTVQIIHTGSTIRPPQPHF